MVNPRIDGHHQPVLAETVAKLLITDTNGAYLDPTVGGGGLLRVLADHLGSEARLYGLDVDPEAVSRTAAILKDVAQFRGVVEAAFADVAEAVRKLEEQEFDGIVLDLGISSDQLDDPLRGISFRYDGPLDMRLNIGSGNTTAAELLKSLDEKELARIIRTFGEEKHAAKIARAIVRERQREVIRTTQQLREIILKVIRPPHQNKSLSRVFQALRITVNREMEQLAEVLPSSLSLLKPGGRLAVIAYHSLEDRQVKQFFQREAKGVCTCPPDFPVCACGAKASLKIITRKPIIPDQSEIDRNPRSRSARLRVAEKIT